MPVKAVLFDVGNVIIRWHPENLYKSLIPDPEKRAFFLNSVASPAWHNNHDAGVSFEDNRKQLLTSYPQFHDEILAYDTRFEEMLGGLIPETLGVLEELHKRSIPLFALTNMPTEKAELVFSKSIVFSYFQDIIISGDEKMAKPDPAIYALTLDRLGLPARDIFFIDDSEVNIAASALQGFVTHHFQSPEGLRTALEHYGLL